MRRRLTIVQLTPLIGPAHTAALIISKLSTKTCSGVKKVGFLESRTSKWACTTFCNGHIFEDTISLRRVTTSK